MIITTPAAQATVVVSREPDHLLIAVSTADGCGSFTLTHAEALELATDLILAGMPAEQFRAGVANMAAAADRFDPQHCPDAENHHLLQGTCPWCEWAPGGPYGDGRSPW